MSGRAPACVVHSRAVATRRRQCIGSCRIGVVCRAASIDGAPEARRAREQTAAAAWQRGKDVALLASAAATTATAATESIAFIGGAAVRMGVACAVRVAIIAVVVDEALRHEMRLLLLWMLMLRLEHVVMLLLLILWRLMPERAGAGRNVR